MFIIRDLSKFSEEDKYNEGCLPNTGQLFDLGVSFTGKTAEEVIDKAADFLGLSGQSDAIEKNACEEPGRVDFALTENEHGNTLSKQELKEWKRGKIKAWYCVYTGYVEKLESVKLD